MSSNGFVGADDSVRPYKFSEKKRKKEPPVREVLSFDWDQANSTAKRCRIAASCARVVLPFGLMW